MLPPKEAGGEVGAKLGLGSAALTATAAFGLFLNLDPTVTDFNAMSAMMGLTTSVASYKQEERDVPSPPITSHSSERALILAADLRRLDAKMYGAYWCSHCYEQKQKLGLEAMGAGGVEYIECSREGLNSRVQMCKAKDVPGYPTWEIGGKLYPGEMELDELEDIVNGRMDK